MNCVPSNSEAARRILGNIYNQKKSRIGKQKAEISHSMERYYVLPSFHWASSQTQKPSIEIETWPHQEKPWNTTASRYSNDSHSLFPEGPVTIYSRLSTRTPCASTPAGKIGITLLEG